MVKKNQKGNYYLLKQSSNPAVLNAGQKNYSILAKRLKWKGNSGGSLYVLKF